MSEVKYNIFCIQIHPKPSCIQSMQSLILTAVTNYTITACFLSNIMLLIYCAGILNINMRTQGNGFNGSPQSHRGLKLHQIQIQTAPEKNFKNKTF